MVSLQAPAHAFFHTSTNPCYSLGGEQERSWSVKEEKRGKYLSQQASAQSGAKWLSKCANQVKCSKVLLTTLRKLLEMVHSVSCSKPLSLKPVKQLPSRRFFKTSATRTENCRSWRCFTIQTASKCGNLFTQTATNQTRFTWTSLWIISLIPPTALWSSISKWNKWCPTCLWSSTHTNCWDRLPTSTRRAFAIAI